MEKEKNEGEGTAEERMAVILEKILQASAQKHGFLSGDMLVDGQPLDSYGFKRAVRIACRICAGSFIVGELTSQDFKDPTERDWQSIAFAKLVSPSTASTASVLEAVRLDNSRIIAVFDNSGRRLPAAAC